MTQKEAIELIDKHKNQLLNPVDMLDWVWLRVIILKIEPEDWDKALSKAVKVLSQ